MKKTGVKLTDAELKDLRREVEDLGCAHATISPVVWGGSITPMKCVDLPAMTAPEFCNLVALQKGLPLLGRSLYGINEDGEFVTIGD